MDVGVVRLEMESDLVPGSVPVTLIRHPSLSADAAAAGVEGTEATGDDGGVPVLVALHGGGGGEGFGDTMAALVARSWAVGQLPPCVVAVPYSGRSFWIDTYDGSARWETFLRTQLVEEVVRLEPRCRGAAIALLGVSMGGLGVLRLAFRSPERYVAVAALEPAIDAAMSWTDVDTAATGVRSLALYEQFHGSPVDPDHFADSHPPALAVQNRQALADAALQIYLECGDEDALGLHKAAELLHRVLWDGGIRHEYHLVRGADHVGRTLERRFTEALAFIGRALVPPPPDPQAEAMRAMLAKFST